MIPSLTLPLPHTLFLVGEICAGKDYVAGTLTRYGYKHLGVGSLIAAELEQLHGLPPGTIYATAASKDQRREQLQAHGNRRRAEDAHYWNKAWWLHRDADHETPYVHTSCRFVAEARAGLVNGAVIARVVVPEAVRQERIAKLYPNHTAARAADPAEGEIRRVPYHFQVFGTLPAALLPQHVALQYRYWQAAGSPLIDPLSEEIPCPSP